MQSGSDSYDSDSRDDSRHDSASLPPRPPKRGTLPVVLASVGLGINLLVVVAAYPSFLVAVLTNSLIILAVLGLVAITGLMINVLAVVFGLSAARGEMPPLPKVACRVSAWVALAQVLTVLALTVAGVVWLPGLLYPTYPTSSTPATMLANEVQRP